MTRAIIGTQKKFRMTRRILLVILSLYAASCSRAPTTPVVRDWRADWALPEGMGLERNAEGFHFPTSLAFVTSPGPGADDPLYFVTELRGKLKVVTRDRSIRTIAENFFALKVQKEIPSMLGSNGLVGVCLAPAKGFAFVTFTYQDANGILRNNMARFSLKPGTLAGMPRETRIFTELFAADESSVAHQIGNCQVANDTVFVGVGDGMKPHLSQLPTATLGKILRLTLDGKPAPGNPLGGKAPASLVWASGFRNPFSLTWSESQLFAADNGNILDRFLKVKKGGNYGWDGEDWSIGTRGDVFFAPTVAPVQMARAPMRSGFLPSEVEGRFFMAMATEAAISPGVLMLDYDIAGGTSTSTPRYFLKYRGPGFQSVGALAFGPDGLYFAPIYPTDDNGSPILKVAKNAQTPHPFLLAREEDPHALFMEKGCVSCHTIRGRGGNEGPPLDKDALLASLSRLSTKEYEAESIALDSLTQDPFPAFKDARAAVRKTSGLEKTRLWIRYRLMEPRFDTRITRMPAMGLSEREATLVADYLLSESAGLTSQERQVIEMRAGSQQASSGIKPLLTRLLPYPLGARHLLLAFTVGAALAAAAILLLRRRST